MTTQTLPAAVTSDEFTVVTTTVRYLQAGDVLTGSGFTVTWAGVPSIHNPRGKWRIQGCYPGKPVIAVTWNASTRMKVRRPIRTV